MDYSPARVAEGTELRLVNLRRVRSLVDRLLAIPCALLPKRYWQSFDLPMPNMAPLSSWLTMLGGFVIGVPGYFAFLERLRGIKGVSILEISKAQVEGTAARDRGGQRHPERALHDSRRCSSCSRRSDCSPAYMVLSGLVRVVASYIDEAHGDPILSGARLARAAGCSRHDSNAIVRVERAKLERTDEPDRRYDGEWAGLTGVDFVIVSARRKPGWTKGTWVITRRRLVRARRAVRSADAEWLAHGVSVDGADDARGRAKERPVRIAAVAANPVNRRNSRAEAETTRAREES